MRFRERYDALTLLLIVLCYGAWGGLVFGAFSLPEWFSALLLIPVITFHSSLQHEIIHGHPFQTTWLNDLLAILPLGLFLPYPRYRDAHLAHHQKARIGDPLDDPESWYLTADKWEQMPGWLKALFTANNILVGRMLLGPLLGTATLFFRDVQAIKNGRLSLLTVWGLHFLSLALLLTAVAVWGSISVGSYLACAYLGMSILMIRTFLEHQAHKTMRGRSVIIEDKGVLSMLFLNNNLHAVHHAYPALAWYRLPGFFKRNRERFLEMNTGYYFKNYGDIIRKYAFSAKEPVIYPLDRDTGGV
ncbi:MAG: fatty acid desaturase [Sneathiella sp.]|nr:MAG: fatty acid desaturase [Sneathiella sp.]